MLSTSIAATSSSLEEPAAETAGVPDSYTVNRIASATIEGGRTIAVEVHRRWSYPDWLEYEIVDRGDSVVIVIQDDGNPDSRWEIVAIPPIPLKPQEDRRSVVVEAIHADSVVLRHCDQMYGIYCWRVKSFFDADERKALGRVEMRPLGESTLLRLNNSIYTVTKRQWNRRNWYEAIVARYAPGEPMLVSGVESSEVIAALPNPPADCGNREESPIRDEGLLHPAVTPLTQPSCFRHVAHTPPLWTFDLPLGSYDHQGRYEYLAGIAIQEGDSYRAYALPQSAPEDLGLHRHDFEDRRPAYTRDINAYAIHEQIGSFALQGNRLWFGKSFYDGEGFTGIGSLGYFEIDRRSYELFRIPEITEWSASAILVEGNLIRVALTHYTEGADSSGGLLRYDTETARTLIHPIKDVITDILGHNGTIYLATEGGRIYVLREDLIVSSFAVEPALEGGFEIRSLSSAQSRKDIRQTAQPDPR